MSVLRVFEAFAGYGSQSMALKRIGVDFEVVGISEIDKYAIQAYMAVHGETPNYGDISRIDWDNVPDFDFLTYSFPCTDISIAGQQRGLEGGSGTRSSLLWECKKAIEIKKPKYLLMENVKALTSKKFMPYFQKWLSYLSDLGYSNYTKVLNAKNYGVPQNRERVFVVSVKNEEGYEFPAPFELKLRLKDILQINTEEKYFLSEKFINTLQRRTEEHRIKGDGFAFIVRSGEDIAAVVKTRAGSQMEDNYILDRGRIRKLTPRECFRLMGVLDEDIDKIQSAGISNTQQYKLAGNSIVVDVLCHIFYGMFKDGKYLIDIMQ